MQETCIHSRELAKKGVMDEDARKVEEAVHDIDGASPQLAPTTGATKPEASQDHQSWPREAGGTCTKPALEATYAACKHLASSAHMSG